MLLAVALILLAAAWRVVAVYVPAMSNFAPLMALTFCGAVYFRDKRIWAVPFVALSISDVFLDAYYVNTFATTWVWPSVIVRLICFALALPIGRLVSQHKSWLNLFAGALAGSLFFYVITNTDAWLRDPFYAKSVAGWWQALTIGRPEYLPTIFFFRNTLISDLLFTGVFAFAMEYVAARQGRESLLASRVAVRSE